MYTDNDVDTVKKESSSKYISNSAQEVFNSKYVIDSCYNKSEILKGRSSLLVDMNESKRNVISCADYSNSVENFIRKHSSKENDIGEENWKSEKNSVKLNFTDLPTPFTDVPMNILKIREIYKNKSKERLNRTFNLDQKERGKLHKETYCRPTVHLINELFVCKTIEKNIKLQRLVSKLMKEMRKYKQNGDWTNFINQLKRKHRSINVNGNTFKGSEHIEQDETDEDGLDKWLLWKCSGDLKNLNDLHEKRYRVTCAYQDRCEIGNIKPILVDDKSYVYKSDQFCYPTYSYGQLIRLDRDNTSKLNNSRSSEERKLNKRDVKCQAISISRHYCSIFPNHTNESDSQTDPNQLFLQNEQKRNITNEAEASKTKVNKNVFWVNEANTQVILEGIETKIDKLLKTVNVLLNEMLLKNDAHKRQRYDPALFYLCNKTNAYITYSKSDTFVNKSRLKDLPTISSKNDMILRENSDDTKLKNLYKNDIYKNQDVNRIYVKKINKTNSIKQNYSSQTDYQNPMIDSATEVTKSLPKAFINDIKTLVTEETQSPSNTQNDKGVSASSKTTVASNTEPLSVLALLRVSTEAIRKLLSYMPTIDYYSYLSALQFSQATKRNKPSFVCHFCGGAFGKASELNEHIKGHNLASTRDCCVCEDVLKTPNCRCSELFKCQYCGRRFTRAYCRELHQQSCAKRLGIPYDVPSGLVFLR